MRSPDRLTPPALAPLTLEQPAPAATARLPRPLPTLVALVGGVVLTATLLALTLLAAAPPAAAEDDLTARADRQHQPLAVELLALVNDERAERDLDPLTWDADLAAMAADWSARMHDEDVFEHRDLGAAVEVEPFASRYHGLGENISMRRAAPEDLAIGSPHLGLMESDGHRANILNPGYDTLGIGVSCDDGTLHVTQVFGVSSWDGWDNDRPTPSTEPIVHDDPSATSTCADHPEATGVPDDGVTDAPSTGLDDTSEQARLAGADRFATAAAIAADAWADGARIAVVATGHEVPDAVAAGAALGGDGPVLLVGEDAVPDSTHDALADLGVEEILVAGGEQAVAEHLLDDLAEHAPVTRVAGADRAATAARLAQQRFTTADEVVLVDGGDTGPALEAGAAAARRGAPVLLTSGDTVPQATREALADLDPELVTVHTDAEHDADAEAEAVAEQLAEVTSAAVEPADAAPEPADTVLVARADDEADALAGSALAAAREVPLVRIDQGGPDAAQRERLAAVGASQLIGLGGPAALCDTSLSLAGAAAGTQH